MRRNIVAGNWKMNLAKQAAESLINQIVTLSSRNGVELILIPPYPYLGMTQSLISDLGHLSVGAQNMHSQEKGAYTGEISAEMLKSLGVAYVVLGHSERRQYFGETDDEIFLKLKMALSTKLSPIYCCGEMLHDRKSGAFQQVVRQQLSESVLLLDKADLDHLIIAYEPVWAIGTGETASPEQAQEMHAFIRSLLMETFGEADVPILYGGSVKAGNARELFAMEDVDGGLVGGASLDSESFCEIAKAFT